MRKKYFAIPIAGLVFLVIVIVYVNFSGQPLSLDNPRARIIDKLAKEYALSENLIRVPSIRVVTGASTASVHYIGFIFVEPDLVTGNRFTDQEVSAVLAHEIGHIARYDSLRFWNYFSDTWAIEKELAADVIGAKLAGREAMCAMLTNHYDEVLNGSRDKKDPHPTPEQRMKAVGGCEKK